MPPDDDIPRDFINELTRAQAAIAAYVRSLLPSHPDYMDVVQEVNLTLWSKRKKFRLGTNFKAWAFKISRYHVMSARRRMAKDAKRLVFSPDLVELLADTTPFADTSAEGELSALQQCLGELRPQDRELLRVRYASGTSIEDYASQHDRNAGTVRATLRRLRGILLKCVNRRLEKELPPPPGDPAWEL